MSRIEQNLNKWGTGTLNGPVSAPNKVNGEQIKRYGPLGIGGVSGVVKNHGGVHEAVFEVSGDEIWTVGGVNSTNAQPAKVAQFAELLVDNTFITVHQPMVGTVDIVFESEDSDGGAVVTEVIGTAAVGVLGTVAVVIAPTVGNLQTFGLGGKLFLDMTLASPQPDPTVKNGGYCDIVVGYRTL